MLGFRERRLSHLRQISLTLWCTLLRDSEFPVIRSTRCTLAAYGEVVHAASLGVHADGLDTTR